MQFKIKTKIFFIFMLSFQLAAFASETSVNDDASEKNEPHFESQISEIFNQAVIKIESEPQSSATKSVEDHEAIIRINKKFKNHELFLKNVVYRSDTNVLRITFSDMTNHDIIKAAYKTGSDPVLKSSVFADKKQIIDIKISYKNKAGEYTYLQLLNSDHNQLNEDVYKLPKFTINGNLPSTKCLFCHTLAKTDGSPSGVFFTRYQKTKKPNPADFSHQIFKQDRFKLLKGSMAKKLKLPPMKSEFMFQKITTNSNFNDEEVNKYMRTLFEMPELIEVMARDNQKSYCVQIVVNTSPKLGTDNYICADNSTKTLHVKFKNFYLVNKEQGLVEYAKPYY